MRSKEQSQDDFPIKPNTPATTGFPPRFMD
jgi:hypothetical protein